MGRLSGFGASSLPRKKKVKQKEWEKGIIWHVPEQEFWDLGCGNENAEEEMSGGLLLGNQRKRTKEMKTKLRIKRGVV